MHVCVHMRVYQSYPKTCREFQAEFTHLVDVTWHFSPLEMHGPGSCVGQRDGGGFHRGEMLLF